MDKPVGANLDLAVRFGLEGLPLHDRTSNLLKVAPVPAMSAALRQDATSLGHERPPAILGSPLRLNLLWRVPTYVFGGTYEGFKSGFAIWAIALRVSAVFGLNRDVTPAGLWVFVELNATTDDLGDFLSNDFGVIRHSFAEDSARLRGFRPLRHLGWRTYDRACPVAA
jgi:hypothetical protein